MTPFLDVLGVDRVDIIGNSMGGGVGIDFAINQPTASASCTIGGIGTNIFSPGPSEGIRATRVHRRPTRERLIAWLNSMVYDQSLVTEQLIEERWIGHRSGDVGSARRMYGKAAFAQMMATMKARRCADAVGAHAQGGLANLAHLGPRRPRKPSGHGADPDAHIPNAEPTCSRTAAIGRWSRPRMHSRAPCSGF